MFSTFPEHSKAKTWWDKTLSGSQPVRLAYVVILGFVRISTNRRVLSDPLTVVQAVQVVDGWIQQPNVEFIAPADGHWSNLKTMISKSNAGSNLITDAHIAASAADYGLIVYSNDTDFARFPSIKTVNPLKGVL
ncbi:MAG: PIN domain-containing protein [Verrucomicrobia bacterium]|nr:PIN domain-containing protein [Verrucomicrobiota bacterium]MDA7667810.1 PIN domain-containing protein [bacterium]MDB4745686.1 PIN domain-containing protein [Verrucomicrobiota bacterium]